MHITSSSLIRESCSHVVSGQKFPTPTPGFGDRVFYETLFRQRPDSLMAQEWCVAYGVLPYNVAERLHEDILARKKGKKVATPVKKSKKVKVEPDAAPSSDTI